ncbi:L,D-transpeptidase family protein [Novosphingobium sp. 1949]|uniref:L,D-transpeptidase family protein n=1 Tax=Novosphingobium organovorum TaxID=2930092 RepID=A0ABT0BBX5_9SPHN|nr:L,D-transpeptidase family protein [Novosphingobium organovorum]MCJ2182557.1 L,D-transpeptidase family protein [Novosphingobium organovorum]
MALTLVPPLAACGATEPQNAADPSGNPADNWDTRGAKALRGAIAGRAAHGLDHLDFDASADPDSAEGRAALTRTALRYAAALARGASDPTKLYDLYTIPRPDPDLKAGLARALAEGKLADWLNGLAPQGPAYTALSHAYLALRAPDARPSPAIPAAPEALRPGASDPRIPAIARQLIASDYLSAPPPQGDRYSDAMVAAVKRMQADYGIKPDGVIGADALGILNLSDQDRARALAVAMERLRWLERDPPKTRIDVNTAIARLAYWRDGKLVDSRKAVVGEPGKETPQLGSPIFRLVANPTWTVPRSIQESEFAGKGAGYLKAHDMAMKDGWIVQQSGPDNSLGLVKFDMQNEHAIYLHDTPAKALFGEVQRQRSHGCVRVDDATGFAARIASDEGVREDWDKARQSGKESFVSLPHAIPVRLLYQTVYLDDHGEPVIHADPYDWDERVARKLGFGTRTGHVLKGGSGDIGP